MKVKTALVSLIRHYRIGLAPGTQIPLKFKGNSFTTLPARRLELVFTPRHPKTWFVCRKCYKTVEKKAIIPLKFTDCHWRSPLFNAFVTTSWIRSGEGYVGAVQSNDYQNRMENKISGMSPRFKKLESRNVFRFTKVYNVYSKSIQSLRGISRF